MGFFKKIHAVVDPIGYVASRKDKRIRNWYKGFDDTLHFWDIDRVNRGIQRQWDADPLGKQLNKLFFPSNNSASAVYKNDIYGSSGTIVGKY